MLQLLQQRIKLSGEIGRMKQRHGAVIYVPERERELVVRLTRLSQGQPQPQALAAIYREIMSSSRAAQGQAPIGLLQASAAHVLPAAALNFGACDRFTPKKTWIELAKGLKSGALSLSLLTGDDLAAALRTDRWRKEFFLGLSVAGDFAPSFETKTSLDRRIFIVTPRRNGATAEADQLLILIECKSTANAIKSLLRSMPDLSLQAEHLTIRSSPPAKAVALVRLSAARPFEGLSATSLLLQAAHSAGLPLSILGIYSGTEDYGG